MKRLLLTGATGFIGHACLERLQHSQFEIHATYRNRAYPSHYSVHWHACNILEKQSRDDLIAKIRPHYLIHLAWIVDHPSYWTSQKNLEYAGATADLYESFSLNGGEKVIFLGTCAEYDKNHSYCNERTTPLNPNTLYGQCKKQALDSITQLYANNSNYAEFCWVRLFNIFGPYEHTERLIPYLFLSYLRATVPILSNPAAIRDYIFVENVAVILIYLLPRKTPQVLNIGSGVEHSLADLAELIRVRYFKTQPAPEINLQITNKENRFVPDLHLFKSLNIPATDTVAMSLDKTYQWWANQIKI